MAKQMRYVSLFSGIEAASCAWNSLGFKAEVFSEIDSFCNEVLKKRYPNVPNIGDITKVDWRDFGNIDIVIGGSPCQSFSIAGKREGLRGESGLMYEYIRAVREIMPRYFIWENVPGALSSEGGEAFGQLLSEMDDLGYGLAWRVLDAQFFGVPQRRRRVFLVGCAGGGKRATEILFEPESVRWDYPSSKDKRETLAAFAPGRSRRSSGGMPGKATTCLADDTAKAALDVELCGTLKVGGRGPIIARTMQMRCGCEGGGKGALIADEMSATLSTSNNQVLFNPIKQPAKAAKYEVRRLTPTECERLQGFPDGWTDVEYKGKQAPDTQRYKALGNSMAVPVIRWIGERVAMVDK